MIQSGLVPTTNKPTRITRDTSYVIDHILTNSTTNSKFKTVTLTSDISDLFPIIYAFELKTKLGIP